MKFLIFVFGAASCFWIFGFFVCLIQLEFDVLAPFIIMFALSFIPLLLCLRKIKSAAYREKKERKRSKREQDAALRADRRAKRIADLEARYAERMKGKTIVEVKLIGGGSSVNRRYGIGGAVVGGLFWGIPGAIVGSVMPKGSEKKQRFAIRYADGHIEVKDALPGSVLYDELIRHVKWEDLK